jgi:hypothetical protein
MRKTGRLLTPALFVGLVLGVALPRPAAAQDAFESRLAAARKLYEDTEYERALLEIQRAKRYAQSDKQRSSLAIYEGILRSEAGQWKRTRALFEDGLTKDPWAKLPLKVSPKVEEIFETARNSVLQKLTFEISSEAMLGMKDPHVEMSGPLRHPFSEWPGPVRKYLEANCSCGVVTISIRCIDLPKKTPIIPLASAVGTAAFLGGFVGFGLQSQSQIDDASASLRQSDAEIHLGRAQSSANRANASLVLSGAAFAAVITTGVLWLKEPPKRECSIDALKLQSDKECLAKTGVH